MKSKYSKSASMHERYAALTKILKSEKLRCACDQFIEEVPSGFTYKYTTKKIRRIIEKRTCQEHHRQEISLRKVFNHNVVGNESRYFMRRAVAYEYRELNCNYKN